MDCREQWRERAKKKKNSSKYDLPSGIFSANSWACNPCTNIWSVAATMSIDIVFRWPIILWCWRPLTMICILINLFGSQMSFDVPVVGQMVRWLLCARVRSSAPAAPAAPLFGLPSSHSLDQFRPSRCFWLVLYVLSSSVTSICCTRVKHTYTRYALS